MKISELFLNLCLLTIFTAHLVVASHILVKLAMKRVTTDTAPEPQGIGGFESACLECVRYFFGAILVSLWVFQAIPVVGLLTNDHRLLGFVSYGGMSQDLILYHSIILDRTSAIVWIAALLLGALGIIGSMVPFKPKHSV